MSNTTTAQDLGQRIEQMIQEHIAASRACALQAVARAFASEAATRLPGASPARRTRAAPGKRRASADIAALGERFYEAVCAKPGERMAVLSGDVGASARELNRSVQLLRHAGRIRSVGSRHQTRYFPLASS
jgi:hypothetical protein